VQCTIAVVFGSVLTVLPETLVSLVVATMFGVGAFLLLREGFSTESTSEEDAFRSGPGPVSFFRSALTSFGVLFAAEWGDASQLATAGLVAHYGHPFAVGAGAFLALIAVAGAAVIIGQKLRSRIRPKLIQRVAGCVFAGFTLIALWQTIS
jgi:putative Ca2+/H+ antiporter (TMEM165/GDT1 family)